MPKWLTLRFATIVVGLVGLLAFIGRAFFDFRFEYPSQIVNDQLIYFAFVYLLIIAAWVWSLFDIQAERRAGLYVLIGLSVVFNLMESLATYAFFCPPGCEGFPTWRFWNNSQMLLGVVVIVVAVLCMTMRPLPKEST